MYTISSQCQESCVPSDLVTVYNPESNQNKVSPKMVMDISVRDLQNDAIKSSENGTLASVVDYMTHKVLISDTTLRSFIPLQVRKMTPKLCQICICEICIIPNDMHIYLNISRTRLVIYLQQKYVVIHTRNSLFSTTSSVQ